MNLQQYEAIIEGILFTMGESVEISKLAAALEIEEAQVREILHAMMERYEQGDRGIQLIEIEDNVQMCTKKELYEYLIKIARQP